MLCGLITTDISTKLISLVQISNKTHSKTSYLNKNVKIRLTGTIYFYIFVKISSMNIVYFNFFILH
ncbi:unknown [Prevotella sp. CAG:1185]|nr:unknown [Prevotella sp. CAG:1185]